jgi:hypothetical protein
MVRELAVLAAVVEAGSEKEAAHRLGLSHSTVKHHLASARSKVRATTTAQLVWILGPHLPEPKFRRAIRRLAIPLGSRHAATSDVTLPRPCLAGSREGRPDEARVLVADEVVTLAGHSLESGAIDDLDEAASIEDQASLRKLGGHGRDGLAAHPEHQREEVVGDREFVVGHAVVHLEEPSSGSGSRVMEAIAADDLGADLQDGLGIPVQNFEQRRIPIDLGPELVGLHPQERAWRLADRLQWQGDSTEVDRETNHAVAANEVDSDGRAVAHLLHDGEDSCLGEIHVLDRPVRRHHLGMALDLHRLETGPKLRFCGGIRAAQGCNEPVSDRETLSHSTSVAQQADADLDRPHTLPVELGTVVKGQGGPAYTLPPRCTRAGAHRAGPTHPWKGIRTMNSSRKQTTTRLFVATIGLAAIALGLIAAPTAGAAGLRRCPDLTGPQAGRAGCYEDVWAAGVQLRMTFSNQGFNGATPQPLDAFYVIAPQTDTPQGAPPNTFPHDHVVRDVPAGNHGNYSVHLQSFFVFCSASGIGSGACVPAMTTIPGLGTVPFAKTVNGRPLTSADAIESAAAAGLVVPINLGPGAVIVGSIGGHE